MLVILASDAGQYGIGALILHRFPNGDERPIAYASRSLNSSERNYSQIKKEGMAIIFGVLKYYMYLCGRKFTLRADDRSLLQIFASEPSFGCCTKFTNVARAGVLTGPPLQYKKNTSFGEGMFYVGSRLYKRLPISATEVAKETSLYWPT